MNEQNDCCPHDRSETYATSALAAFNAYMPKMNRTFATLAALFCLASSAMATSSSSGQDSQAMIFLPPGAAYCRDFLHLEPMVKYDNASLPVREGEAEDYFIYRGIEEWIRGFVTAANILNAERGSGDITKGKDIYELMPQLFEYCRSHRDEIFSDAAMQLFSPARPSVHK